MAHSPARIKPRWHLDHQIVRRPIGARKHFFDYRAGASEATFNTQQYRALVQGPLVKGALNLSLTGQYSTSDGFIQNTFLQSHADEREGFNGRASMRWTPNDNWDVRFTATADRFND